MWGTLNLGAARGAGGEVRGFPTNLTFVFDLCLGGCCPVELELPDLGRSKSG